MKSKRICELCISSEKAAVFLAEMFMFSWLFFVTSSVLLVEIKKIKFDEHSVLCVSGWRALQNYIQWQLSLPHQLWKSHIKSFTNTLSLNLETPSETLVPHLLKKVSTEELRVQFQLHFRSVSSLLFFQINGTGETNEWHRPKVSITKERTGFTIFTLQTNYQSQWKF